jgi:dihydroorotate dehydrogenase electron transfer subunit
VSVCEIPSLGLAGQVLSAVQHTAVIVGQKRIADNTYQMRLECPAIARQILPGQFFMLRTVDRSDPLLGRPFALLDVVRDAGGQPTGIDFGYVVIGKFTGLLKELPPGTPLEIWGPLGNGFASVTDGHLAIVAGGIGQTPFVAVVREALGLDRYGDPVRQPAGKPRKITVCYGARKDSLLAGLDWFQLLGVDLRIATDDGSQGHRGYVTDLLRQVIASDDPPTTVYCCGPEPMMRAVAEITGRSDTPAWLSLETPMACGFGACFSCVTRLRQPDGTWDYRRVCVEGPVFPADQIVFE